MNPQSPEAPAEGVVAPAPRPAEEIADQIRAEYARFLEKRDAVRKSNGKVRRAILHALLN